MVWSSSEAGIHIRKAFLLAFRSQEGYLDVLEICLASAQLCYLGDPWNPHRDTMPVHVDSYDLVDKTQ